MDAPKPSIASIQDIFDGKLRPGVSVETFSHAEALFPVKKAAKGKTIRPLSHRQIEFPDIRFQHDGGYFDLIDYLSTNRIAGLLVLKDGEVALENYELGLTPAKRWASMSVAKSISSTLLGIALEEGAIASLDDNIGSYVGELEDSVYGSVSIQQLVTMTTGVRWSEVYADPQSHRRKLLEAQLTWNPGAIIGFMRSLSRDHEPGKIFNYNTGETYILGAVIERATDQPLPEYLSTKLWSKLGMEQDAFWWLESPGGMALAGSGICATLRDFGKFGHLVAEGGNLHGQQLVSRDWLSTATSSQIIDGTPTGYGYNWWVPETHDPALKNSFFAEGIYGQYIFIHPQQNLVIVVLSARSKPSSFARLEFDDLVFFSAVTRALK